MEKNCPNTLWGVVVDWDKIFYDSIIHTKQSAMSQLEIQATGPWIMALNYSESMLIDDKDRDIKCEWGKCQQVFFFS